MTCDGKGSCNWSPCPHEQASRSGVAMERVAKGLCALCQNPRAPESVRLCNVHLEKNRLAVKKHLETKENAGLCIGSGCQYLALNGRKMCAYHLQAVRKRLEALELRNRLRNK